MTTKEDTDATLKGWAGYDIGRGMVLTGKIYGDTLTTGKHPFPDGEEVTTSFVRKIENGVALTKTGTRYALEN